MPAMEYTIITPRKEGQKIIVEATDAPQLAAAYAYWQTTKTGSDANSSAWEAVIAAAQTYLDEGMVGTIAVDVIVPSAAPKVERGPFFDALDRLAPLWNVIPGTERTIEVGNRKERFYCLIHIAQTEHGWISTGDFNTSISGRGGPMGARHLGGWEDTQRAQDDAREVWLTLTPEEQQQLAEEIREVRMADLEFWETAENAIAWEMSSHIKDAHYATTDRNSCGGASYNRRALVMLNQLLTVAKFECPSYATQLLQLAPPTPLPELTATTDDGAQEQDDDLEMAEDEEPAFAAAGQLSLF